MNIWGKMMSKLFDKKDIFSWSNCEEAKKYIGEEGYFRDDYQEDLACWSKGLLQTKGEKAHGFNRGMIAPKMCVYNLNKHLQIYYNVRYEERIQTHKNDCILN